MYVCGPVISDLGRPPDGMVPLNPGPRHNVLLYYTIPRYTIPYYHTIQVQRPFHH